MTPDKEHFNGTVCHSTSHSCTRNTVDLMVVDSHDKSRPHCQLWFKVTTGAVFSSLLLYLSDILMVMFQALTRSGNWKGIIADNKTQNKGHKQHEKQRLSHTLSTQMMPLF